MKLDIPTADELNFVFDSWARSFQKSKWAGCIPNNLYDSVSRTASAEIIDRGARVTVAVEEQTDGTRNICGYVVWEPKHRAVHFVYVKRALRGFGIGKRLLNFATAGAREGWCYTHKTNAADKFARGMVHEPCFARAKY